MVSKITVVRKLLVLELSNSSWNPNWSTMIFIVMNNIDFLDAVLLDIDLWYSRKVKCMHSGPFFCQSDLISIFNLSAGSGPFGDQ